MINKVKKNPFICGDEYSITDVVETLNEVVDELNKLLEQPSFEEWLSSFNTESAPQCFNAVQQLKKQIEKKQNT